MWAWRWERQAGNGRTHTASALVGGGTFVVRCASSVLAPSRCMPFQNKLFGSLVGSAACTVQLELRPSAAAVAAGGVQPTVSIKTKRDELETLPLFCNKDTIAGEVRPSARLLTHAQQKVLGADAGRLARFGPTQTAAASLVPFGDALCRPCRAARSRAVSTGVDLCWPCCALQLCVRALATPNWLLPEDNTRAVQGRFERAALCTAAAAVSQVKVTPIPGKRADHQGIRVQLLGEVELASERGHPHQFLSLGAAWLVHAS